MILWHVIMRDLHHLHNVLSHLQRTTMSSVAAAEVFVEIVAAFKLAFAKRIAGFVLSFCQAPFDAGETFA